MGTEQDDPHAARRAEMEQTFQSLPAAGTPDYWRRIEQATPDTALPLEVLARCVRERAHAGALDASRRICRALLERIQRTVQHRMQSTARPYEHGQQHELASDLAQECYVQLWKELVDPEPTFLCEHFMHALKRLMDHVEHSIMEHEGYWKRRDVETPKRVPIKEQDSLDKPIAPGEQRTRGQTLPDPADDYRRVDLETDIAALLDALQPEDRNLLHNLFWSELTQEQVAERLGITDRTVRNRLNRILDRLRNDYLGGEEGEHGE
ncbi:MAG TPA: sigma-70 family RNA polymerase sigma factor [Ktedonobacterales bacterium]|nr:sigma-70 family RNA polymerase sigma factor [Ktedonobacterales bacterium]